LHGGVDQGSWQVAVMIGPSVLAWAGVCGHSWSIANYLVIDKIVVRAYVDSDKIEVLEVKQ
jgi:hypothetical protein